MRLFVSDKYRQIKLKWGKKNARAVWKKSVRYTEKICMFVYMPSQCIMSQLFALSLQLSEQQTSTKTQQKGGISAPSNNDYRGDTPLAQR